MLVQYKNLIILASVVFFVSCANKPYISGGLLDQYPSRRCDTPSFFGVSPSVPDHVAPIVSKGFLYWNDVVGKDVYFDVGSIPYEHTSKNVGVAVIPIGVEKEYTANSCANTLVRFDSRGCITKTRVSINPAYLDRTTDWIETLVRHEAGHALGLAHSPGRYDLMYRNVIDEPVHPVEASDDEIYAVRKLYGENYE